LRLLRPDIIFGFTPWENEDEAEIKKKNTTADLNAINAPGFISRSHPFFEPEAVPHRSRRRSMSREGSCL
jgi:hypothetical protein